MRNLVALRRAVWRLPRDSSTASTCMAVNLTEQVVYILDARSGRLESLAIDGEVDATPELLVELSDAILTPEGSVWMWIEYIAELDALVCGSSSGTLAVIDLQSREPEEIGVLNGGLVAMAWSSNQETLALFTGVGTLLIMNTQWEVLHETHVGTHLEANGVALAEAVDQAGASLAWRDDAQYLVLNISAADAKQGSAGVRKVLVFTHELALHAVGRLEDGRAIPHLGDSVDWCPNHSLIASHETRKDQLFVVFFERNGLRHGEFALPSEYAASAGACVKALKWNTQSDVLAVHVEALNRSRLLLYTRNNYHWYLKQELVLGGLHKFAWDAERSALLHLVLAQDDSPVRYYEQREFAWDVSCGERQLSDDSASVVAAVIDGVRLLLTPLQQTLVPPPMALHTLTFSSPVNAVMFDAFSESLAVALSSGAVVVVQDFLSSDNAAVHTQVLTDVSITGLAFLRRLTSTEFTLAAKQGGDDALALWRITDNDAEPLLPSEDVTNVARACEVADGEARVAARTHQFAVQSHQGQVLLVSMPQAGQDKDDTVNVAPISTSAPVPLASRLEVLRVSSDRHLTIALSAATAKLSVDGTPVATAACSSFRFCIFSHALLFTTLGSAAHLRFLPLQSLLVVSTPVTSDDQTENHHRVVERGARIVAVIGDRASVVLQLPRGNLEGVAPRLLVLALAVAHLRRQAYRPALELARRHRLDLNLLVDYAPTTFLSAMPEQLIDAYVDARTPPHIASDRLCLLLTSLHVVDVWQTKYKPQLFPFLSQHSTTEDDNETPTTAKDQDAVNGVCRAVMAAIEQRGVRHDALLLPFLTAAVKQSPPDVAAALTLVQDLLRDGDETTARVAVKHLIFLTHVDALFDATLALYDLGLVRFVAAFSPRDPKEYVPFLDACEAIASKRRRQLAIDRHLQRHDKALDHLAHLILHADDAKATDEDIVAELVVKGALYDQALALFSATTSDVPAARRLRTRVLQLKAEYLSGRGDHEAAAYVLLSIEAYAPAMKSFKSARQWRMALAIAPRVGVDGPALNAFARELVDAVLTRGDGTPQPPLADVLAAAQLLVEYGENVDEAVALLVTHRVWDESLRVAHRHGRADLVETEVAPGVATATETLLEDIAQREREYTSLWQRLSTVREQKRLFKLHGIDGRRWEQGGDHEDDDGAQSSIASGVSSVASSARSMRSVGSHNSVARSQGNFALQRLTAATGSHFFSTQSQSQFGAASAAEYKSRRYGGLPSRTERKRRFKEGSLEEETYVAKQLHANAPSASMLHDVRDVLRVLVSLGRVELAMKLQKALSAFQQLIRNEYPLLPLSLAPEGRETEESVDDLSKHVSLDEAWRFPGF